MKSIGVIAELNPPHTGHLFLINTLRSMGYSHIAVVLSGNFVQRGEPAIFSKWLRASWALKLGVDLVISLPVVHSVACAERFAKAGVFLLSKLGVDAIGFASECGDIAKLKELSLLLYSDKLERYIDELVSTGNSLAAARAKALSNVLGEDESSAALKPNNILALEYLRALEYLKEHIEPVTIPRVGSAHDLLSGEDAFASASFIRKSIFEGNYKTIWRFLPNSLKADIHFAIENGYILDRNVMDILTLGKWRTASIEYIRGLSEVSEGLEFRMKKAALESVRVSQLLDNVKTKRYTHARLRRILMSGLLGIGEDIQQEFPPYIHVLGMSSRGSELLRNTGLKSSTSLAKLSKLNAVSNEFVRIEEIAGNLYTMAQHRPMPCGMDFTTPVARENF